MIAMRTLGIIALGLVRDRPFENFSRFNFIARHWHGLYPLWISFWIINVVVTIAYLAAVALIVAGFSSKTGYEPLSIFWSITSVWLCVVAIVIWQVVGLWRSVGNDIQRRAALGKKSLWASLAKAAVIFTVFSLFASFATTGLPQLVETARMAFMGDPDIAEYSIRIMRNGTEVEVSGGFKYGLTDEFRKLLKASPRIKVVHLDSTGGRVGEAEKLYEVIRENGLITYVPSKCASACTIAFAGGKQRYIAPKAILAFHGPAFPGMTKKSLAASIAEQKRLFRSAGFASEFTTKALNTPSAEYWRPTLHELWEAKVITGVSDGTQFVSSGSGGR